MGKARLLLTEQPSSPDINTITMEERIFKELEEIKRLSLLAAKNVLTISEVATLTGLSKAYIYKQTWQRTIPHYKPTGKLVFFDRSEVEAWMKQNRVETVQEAEQKAAARIVRKAIDGKGGAA